MNSFAENNVIKITAIAAPEDAWTGSPATDVINMKNFDEITFGVWETSGGTGTTTLTLEECDDVTPSTSTAIAFSYATITSATTTGMFAGWTRATSSGVTPTAGANKLTLVKVHSSELSDGYPYVRLQTTEVDSTAVDGGIFIIASKPAYAGESMPDPSV